MCYPISLKRTPTAIDAIENASAGSTKNKVSGMGVKKRKNGRPRKGRDGDTLFPAGNYGPTD